MVERQGVDIILCECEEEDAEDEILQFLAYFEYDALSERQGCEVGQGLDLSQVRRDAEG